MRSVKLFLSTTLRAGLMVVGAGLVLTAMGSTASAFDGVTPEIDPGSLASAVTLLTGSVLLLTGRRHKK